MNNEFPNENSTTNINMNDNLGETVVESISNNNENENNNIVINEYKNGESNNLRRRKSQNNDNDENYLNNGKNEINDYNNNNNNNNNNLNEDNSLFKEQNVIKNKKEEDSSNKYIDDNNIINSNNNNNVINNNNNNNNGKIIIVNNINITINQKNEINKTSNEVTINKNNQINNTTNITNTKTNNVKIEESINNKNSTVYNYIIRFFKYIEHLLNKGCKHDNQTIRVTSRIFKKSYSIFCVVFNTSINTLIRVYNFFHYVKCKIAQIKNFIKICKEICWSLIIIVIIYRVLRNDSIRKFLINCIKSLFGKKSLPPVAPTENLPIVTPTPTSTPNENINFSNINNISNKMISAYNAIAKQNSYDIIRCLIKLGNEKINGFYNQMGTFIIDNTKSAYNYTNSVINSSTLIVRDKTYQIYNAINSTIYNSIPILKSYSIKLQPAINSTITSISKCNEIAHFIIVNITPEKIVTSSTEIIKPVLNNCIYLFNLIKGAIVGIVSSSESTKEATNKVTETVVKTTSTAIVTTTTINNQNTLKAFFKNVGKILHEKMNKLKIKINK